MSYAYFYLQSKHDESKNFVVDFRDGRDPEGVSPPVSATRLIVFPKKTLANDNKDNQLLEFDFSGDPPYFFITNKLGLVIDRAAGSDGRLVGFRRKVSGTDNQLWSLDPLDATETYYYITSKLSGAGVITVTDPIDPNSDETEKRNGLLVVRAKGQGPQPDDHQLWRIVKA